MQMGQWYRRDMHSGEVCFDRDVQHLIVDATRRYARFKQYKLYAVTTESTHVHVMIGWQAYQPHQLVQRGIKSTISRQLNAARGRRNWFSRSGSRKRVRDRSHFQYLMTRYLPRHRGASWYQGPATR
jgi:REP element-mobilizing transposase RayT